MKNRLFWPLLAGVVTTLAPLAARADEPNQCEEPHAIDKYALLRRLSLDLRGSLPTVEEFDALDAENDVPAATIQQYIESDEFRMVMRRYHEALFWPNITQVQLSGVTQTISPSKDVAWRIASIGRSKLYRGDPDVSCGDYQQTHFDPKYPGEYRPDPAFIQKDANGHLQEGWRMVAPYWDPANPIKVCAFDAMETPSATVKGKTAACNTPAGTTSAECACGPNLGYCYSSASTQVLYSSIREQLARAVDKVAKGAKYTDLILSHASEENGPIAYWRKNFAPNTNFGEAYTGLDTNEPIAKIDDFTAVDAWATIDRGAGHAGVLTMPGYLLRFQTNRGRANRFRINFLCEFFIPPDHVDPQPGCSADANDLTQRCNCQYCHATLEPLAAHFAGFSEAGTTRLTADVGFPKTDATCVGQTAGRCARYYVTASDAHNPGSLLALQFADAHADYEPSFDAGPEALAQKIVDDGSFASCTVKKMMSFFLKRDAELDGTVYDEQATVDALAKSFSVDWDVRNLVRNIVTLRQYRRTR